MPKQRAYIKCGINAGRGRVRLDRPHPIGPPEPHIIRALGLFASKIPAVAIP